MGGVVDNNTFVDVRGVCFLSGLSPALLGIIASSSPRLGLLSGLGSFGRSL